MADDAIRNLESQKRWLNMAMDDARDFSGIEQKIQKFRATLDSSMSVLAGHPYVASARQYLVEQENLFIFKQATEQAEREISKAKNLLRYAEMSMPQQMDRAKQQVQEAIAVATGLLSNPQYSGLPVVHAFAPAFLAGPAKEMDIKVNSAAILQEAEDKIRVAKNNLRYVQGQLDSSNAEGAQRYLKAALDAAQPLRADPKFLIVPEVVAFLNDLAVSESELGAKIKHVGLISEYQSAVYPARNLERQMENLKTMDDVTYMGKDRALSTLSQLKKTIDDFTARFGSLDVAAPTILSMRSAAEKAEQLLGVGQRAPEPQVVVRAPPPQAKPEPQIVVPASSQSRTQEPQATRAPTGPPIQQLPPAPAAAPSADITPPPMGLSVEKAQSLVEASRSEIRWAKYYANENDSNRLVERLGKAKTILAPLLAESASPSDWERDRTIVEFVTTFRQDSVELEAKAAELTFASEFDDDSRKIGRLISNLQNYTDAYHLDRSGSGTALKYVDDLLKYVENIKKKFGTQRLQVQEELKRATDAIEEGYRKVEAYEKNISDTQRNKRTRLLPKFEEYYSSLDAPVRDALSSHQSLDVTTLFFAVLVTKSATGMAPSSPTRQSLSSVWSSVTLLAIADKAQGNVSPKSWPAPPPGTDADVSDIPASQDRNIVVAVQPAVDKPAELYDVSSVRMPYGTRMVLIGLNHIANEFNKAEFQRGPHFNLDDFSGDGVRTSLKRLFVAVLEEYPNPILAGIAKDLQTRLKSLAINKKVRWPKIVADMENNEKVKETLTQMNRYIDNANAETNLGRKRDAYKELIQYGQIRVDNGDDVDSVTTLLAEGRKLFRETTEAYIHELSGAMFSPDWNYMNNLAAEIETLGQDQEHASRLREWITKAKVDREQKEADKKEEDAKRMAEYAEIKKKEAEELQKKLKAIYLDPYTGGRVTVAGETWEYYSNGTLKGPRCEIRFTGSEILPVSGLPNSGFWNGERFSYYCNWKTIVTHSWNDSNRTFSPTFTEALLPVTWRWDGEELIPTDEIHRKMIANVKGSVPLPVVLFASMFGWLQGEVHFGWSSVTEVQNSMTSFDHATRQTSSPALTANDSVAQHSGTMTPPATVTAKYAATAVPTVHHTHVRSALPRSTSRAFQQRRVVVDRVRIGV
ncbi:hypothetical protein HDU93_009948 [Gonapodya sp. JEL0774]|nr:hypothetical protein HDU93_009948 [Gonapodya sp. JEL0774]